MRANKSFLRSAFDALIEARTREAERTIAYFRHDADLDTTKSAKR